MTQRQSGNSRVALLGSLDDPALENEILCVVEQLFPIKANVSSSYVTYGQQLPTRPDRAGPIDVTVTSVALGAAIRVQTPGPGRLEIDILQGRVLRLTLYSLVREEHFTTGLGSPKAKFQSFMRDAAFIKGAMPSSNSAGESCIAFTPVELWIEGARLWSEPALQAALPSALWDNLQITSAP